MTEREKMLCFSFQSRFMAMSFQKIPEPFSVIA